MRGGRTLTGLVWAATAGVLVQAVVAGQFLSGVADVLLVHTLVGSALEPLGLALVVVAVVDRGTRRRRRGASLAALLLGVGLIVQAVLGHAPGAAATAVHVPLGVVLFGLATSLSVVLARPPRPREGAGTVPSGADSAPAVSP